MGWELCATLLLIRNFCPSGLAKLREDSAPSTPLSQLPTGKDPITAVGKMRRQNLDGNDSVEAGIFGAVHLTHPSGANSGEDLKGAQLGSRRQTHRATRSPSGCADCSVDTRAPKEARGSATRLHFSRGPLMRAEPDFYEKRGLPTAHLVGVRTR